MSEKDNIRNKAIEIHNRIWNKNEYDGPTQDSQLYDDGGPKTSNYKSANSWSNGDWGRALAKVVEPIAEPVSSAIMEWGRTGEFKSNRDDVGTAQDTYLLDRYSQEKTFLDRGYQKVLQETMDQ